MGKEYPAAPVVGVGGVVVRDGQALIVRRAHEPRRGEWSIPGGVVELGERLTDAVRRELREETGFHIETTELLGIHSRVIPGSQRVHRERTPLHTIRIVYRAEITGGRLRFEQNGSTDMAAWFTIPEVAELQRVKLVDIALRMAGII